MKQGDDPSKRANRRRKVVLVLLALLLLTVLLVDLFQPDGADQPAEAPTLKTLVEEGAGDAPDDGRCLYADYCVDYVAGRDNDAASTSGRVASVRAGGSSDAGQLFDRLSPRGARFEYDANFGVACSSSELCLGGLGAGAPISTLALSVGNKPLPEETGERLVLQGYLPREAWDRTDGAGESDASVGDLALVPSGGIGSFNGGLTAGGFGGGGFVGGSSGGRPGSPSTPAGSGPEQQQPPARNQVLGDSGSNGGAGGGGGNSGGNNVGGSGNSSGVNSGGANSGGGNAGGANAGGGSSGGASSGGGNSGSGNAGGGNTGGGNTGGGSPNGGNAGGGGTPGGGNHPAGGGGNPGGGSNGPNVPLDQYLDDEIGGGSGDGGGGNLFTPPGDPDDSSGSGSSGQGGGDNGGNGDGGGGGQVVIEDLPGIGDEEEDLQPSEVPEPANLVLVGTGLAYGLLQWRKRRSRT